uniref:C-type lectin domain-containing protein n=1 Tax=Amphilophus citrinellus TaxID=61819 RepID=A0A3Q0RMW7_AMPCI
HCVLAFVKFLNLFVMVCFSTEILLCLNLVNKTSAGQYILITQNMVWTVARDYCRTHHTDLTSLRNDAEYQMVQKAAGGFEVWVGLFRDTWAWSDQSDSSLRYWNASQSVWTHNYSRGGLMKTEAGRWGELSCEETHPFLCDCSE